ncbi:MAG: aminotransferase class I/II-fold pyridoxal phosphate-dependent enzyme [Acidimicrobiia bacterium]|nr:aminotransferase class I/II-fold pyridoxal phosphate-dependent enzyme [Acidimicrobiia bacterium]
MADDRQHGFATEAIHAGEIHDATGAHIAPIYQTSTFTFADMEAVEDWADGKTEAYIYSRGGNPGRKALAEKLAALEGFGLDPAGQPVAEIFASGMAAISAAIMGTAKAGNHIITQQVLYGSADHLISDVLPDFGITNSRVPGLEAAALEHELRSHQNTTAVYLETPANPTLRVIDIATTARIAHEHGAQLIVDNTFATPALQRPLSLGADVVVHSTTKYINGHGTIVGGAVVSTDSDLMENEIASLIRFTGGVPGALDCWLANLGLKTLPLRMSRHCSTAMQVARFLEDHPAIVTVHYPGLPGHPQHDVAARQMADFGAMLAFDAGSYEAATSFLNRLNLCTLAVSLGNLDTLVEHPASMTHRVVPPEQRAASGISDGLIRVSVGLEDPADIIADLDRALGG